MRRQALAAAFFYFEDRGHISRTMVNTKCAIYTAETDTVANCPVRSLDWIVEHHREENSSNRATILI